MRHRLMAAASVSAMLMAGSPAMARITQLDVQETAQFADGASFGAAGPYVRIKAVAKGELDPAAPENSGIALLAQAPRNARGMVEYETDVFILRPLDPTKGDGTLLYEVTNRGNKFLMSWINDAGQPPGNGAAANINDPRSVADAGNGFSFRRGWTIVWSGWQPEAPTANHGMTLRVPVATNGGKPIVSRIRNEIEVGTRGPEDLATIRLPYPAANTDTAQATLTVRAREAGPRIAIAPGGWEFIDRNSIRLLPAGTKFAPRQIYDLWYDAAGPSVDGIGFAATRDVVSYLRHGADPAVLPAASVQRAIGFGISLSGRYLRHFLDLGMNHDSDGARVFDGVLAHISGAGKVFNNEPFAMPYRTTTQHEDRFYPENWPPYGYIGAHSLLHGGGTDPLVIETNTSTEYWQKGASLTYADQTTGAAIPQPDTVRSYLIAGTQHGGNAWARPVRQACANARNPHSADPALRALLVDLEDWITKGTAPPPSLVPQQADGSGVRAAAVHYPAIPGITWPGGGNAIGAPVDWIDPPRKVAHPFATLVSAVDADGNETAGLRLPDIAVPAATYTGTNVYADDPSELCDRDGTFAPFARTAGDREASGDPRASMAERYGSKPAYVAKLRAAADDLVARRLLLAEDADRYVAQAAATPDF